MEKAKQVNNQVAGDEHGVEMVVLQDKSHGMMRGTLRGSRFGLCKCVCYLKLRDAGHPCYSLNEISKILQQPRAEAPFSPISRPFK